MTFFITAHSAIRFEFPITQPVSPHHFWNLPYASVFIIYAIDNDTFFRRIAVILLQFHIEILAANTCPDNHSTVWRPSKNNRTYSR